MSASAVDLLSALRTAQAQRQLSAAAVGQASGWLQSGALPAAALESLADLIARGAVAPPRRRGDWIPDDPLLLSSGARVDRALNQVRS